MSQQQAAAGGNIEERMDKTRTVTLPAGWTLESAIQAVPQHEGRLNALETWKGEVTKANTPRSPWKTAGIIAAQVGGTVGLVFGLQWLFGGSEDKEPGSTTVSATKTTR